MVSGHQQSQENSMRTILLALVIGGTLSACGNWVNLTAAGRLVTVATPTEVASCRRIGTSTSNALSEIVFVERGSAKLQAELIDLARNEAADMGGNRIVVESPITEGRQSFGVYSCAN
jgi:dihydroxyacetone kinase DhaKLM complex PTS-EIIA-like component DhaM